MAVYVVFSSILPRIKIHFTDRQVTIDQPLVCLKWYCIGSISQYAWHSSSN